MKSCSDTNGWGEGKKREHANIKTVDSTHKVARRPKKLGCSPQLSDLSLKTNSSN